MHSNNGYGYATDRMVDSLSRLGWSVKENDHTADVAMVFDQPQNARWYGTQPVKILFHPWESTKLQPGWVDIMNDCDEVWTPSPLIADWYRADGVSKPIFVYEHGVDHKLWTPKKREESGKIRFLHVGAEATRKGGWDTLRLFRAAFANRDDVELTLKMVNMGFKLERVGKTSIINRVLSLRELIDLYHAHHVFVYPSWGEGFGLNPLQAMATGMPTICTAAWAPYERFLDPNLKLGSELKKSPWQEIHPGKMLRPKFDELVDKMRWAADNYDQAQDFAMGQVAGIQTEYDWDNLTKVAFENLESRL